MEEHRSELQLLKFARGKLRTRDAQQIKQHLDGCMECKVRYQIIMEGVVAINAGTIKPVDKGVIRQVWATIQDLVVPKQPATKPVPAPSTGTVLAPVTVLPQRALVPAYFGGSPADQPVLLRSRSGEDIGTLDAKVKCSFKNGVFCADVYIRTATAIREYEGRAIELELRYDEHTAVSDRETLKLNSYKKGQELRARLSLEPGWNVTNRNRLTTEIVVLA